MDLQYILNESGEKTAVIIPIEEWRQILDLTDDLQDLQEITAETDNRRPSDAAGVI